jgi:hypothetical protein
MANLRLAIAQQVTDYTNERQSSPYFLMKRLPRAGRAIGAGAGAP